jgi:hypothetical protein
LTLLLFAITAFTFTPSYGQALSHAVIVAREDTASISGQFINAPLSSSSIIHYTVSHDTTTNTVAVEISSLDAVNFVFNIMDTTAKTVQTSGSVSHSAFTTTVNVSSLNTGYLLFYIFSDLSGPAPLFFTTFR